MYHYIVRDTLALLISYCLLTCSHFLSVLSLIQCFKFFSKRRYFYIRFRDMNSDTKQHQNETNNKVIDLGATQNGAGVWPSG
jgi:hypothetical protein